MNVNQASLNHKDQSFDVLGVHLSVTSLDDASDKIIQAVQQDKSEYVCVAPVSTVVACRRDADYAKVVNNAFLVTPDGMPLVWVARSRGLPVTRTYGPDLMRTIFKKSQQQPLKHFFYGGQAETNHVLQTSLKRDYPWLDIVGMFAPAMRSVGFQETDDVIDRINRSKADIVWVGLGSPKQDVWMRDHRQCIKAPIMVGVGAGFDFLAGLKPQAPRWMQRSGLEWLFRLLCEPRRLAGRYLIGNSLFLWYLFLSFFQKSSKS